MSSTKQRYFLNETKGLKMVSTKTTINLVQSSHVLLNCLALLRLTKLTLMKSNVWTNIEEKNPESYE
jgi:hypothetical protein